MTHCRRSPASRQRSKDMTRTVPDAAECLCPCFLLSSLGFSCHDSEDGSGDINTIELSDMMRELGQAPRIEEAECVHLFSRVACCLNRISIAISRRVLGFLQVRSLLASVDINGNGVLDIRDTKLRAIDLFKPFSLPCFTKPSTGLPTMSPRNSSASCGYSAKGNWHE